MGLALCSTSRTPQCSLILSIISNNTPTIYRKQEIVRNSDDFQLEVRLWLGSHVEISRQLRLSTDALVIPSSLSSLAVSAISAVVEDIQDWKKAFESI